MSDSPFKMPGSQHLGRGNQSVSPGKYTASPAKDSPHTTTNDHKAHTETNTSEKENHWNYGSVNAKGNKIVDKKGNWVSLTRNTEGPAIRDTATTSGHSKTIKTEEGDVVNQPQ